MRRSNHHKFRAKSNIGKNGSCGGNNMAGMRETVAAAGSLLPPPFSKGIGCELPVSRERKNVTPRLHDTKVQNKDSTGDAYKPKHLCAHLCRFW
jgi:hypothetical protein